MTGVSLDRFVKAQEHSYETALKEIKRGRKSSHWMWYIFPQIKGLGFSPTAQYYAIEDREEAEEYMKHPLLSKRLFEISEELLKLDSSDPRMVMGCPDDLKLKSSMTLFYLVSGNEVFRQVLHKFYQGKLDEKTVRILEKG